MCADQCSGIRVGFDIGSVAMKVVLTDSSGRLLRQSYSRTLGRPVETALKVLGELLHDRVCEDFEAVAGTGSAGRLICQLLEIPFVNEVIAQAAAIRHLHPQVRTLIDMGGQDNKLIYLSDSIDGGQSIVDFAMNTSCAAGTGSFLDQQASRLGICIEGEFGELASRCKCPPRVAGRCSVFAKSDMIHLQQQAAPVEDIVAGLCLGLARNLKSNLGRGVDLPRPIAFCGGVAANRGVVHAIEEVLGLSPGELIVPDCHACTGALGAILVHSGRRAAGNGQHMAEGDEKAGNSRLDLERLRDYLARPRTLGHRLEPLNGKPVILPGMPDHLADKKEKTTADSPLRADGPLPVDAWLGLDVGSISTKAAVIDADNRVLAKIYLMTAGRPLDAVRDVLREIRTQVEGKVRIRGAATTGSGRYLTGDFIGADLVVNEITAQATAAAAIDPTVDTIFEIGGQDSKYISLDRGVVVDFEMNHACAAGTGSFLEEQAERLGVQIKGQFANLALHSHAPIRLGERCTVFMESDMISYQQQGAATEDLAAGLCYSIVSNYINRVVGHRRIGQRIFFQGGTAFNQGVVAAFQKYTGSKITVPPDHEVTGAIGAAILARREQERRGRDMSGFGGFDLVQRECKVRSFECTHCSNNCEINEVMIPGRDPLYYGSRCDRYNTRRQGIAQEKIPNLFAERNRLLFQHANLKAHRGTGRPKIGIPLALSNYHLLPLWGTLLGELGFDVVVNAVSSQQVVHRGVESVLSTPCFPVKVAHGHVLELIDKGVDRIWLPSVVSMAKDDVRSTFNQLCPYVTSIPYQVEPMLQSQARVARVLKPAVRLDQGAASLLKSLKSLGRELGIGARRLRIAVNKAWEAQEQFEEACRRRGREVLDQLDPSQRAMVIIGRPYNGCDPGVCLDLPNKLRKLGVLPIPMDFLDLQSSGRFADDPVFAGMYWKYGQKILCAADEVSRDSRLHAIYLSNFGCGPDSFLIGYAKRVMAHKPCLVLEIDEHSADAGIVTRLEAFLESINHAPAAAARAPISLPMMPVQSRNGRRRTIYVPWMGDQAYAVVAAIRAFGTPSQVIPVADQQSVELGRRMCSGKECLPCIITTGDMIRTTRLKDFDPDHAAFFMPGGSGPCRFGQYNCLQKLVLEDLGLGRVPVISPSQDKQFYDEFSQLGSGVSRLGWCGSCAVEILMKARLAIRPYEQHPGETEKIYRKWLDDICHAIEFRATDEGLRQRLQLAAEEFEAVSVDRRSPRPRIGVLGEIYIRHHDFANNDLIRQLESLGAEVVLAPLSEWVYYSNWARAREAWDARSIRQWAGNMLTDRVQRRIHQRLAEPFEPLLGERLHEASVGEVLDLADPYLHRSFISEAGLSVGKMIEFRRQGCHGVINVMPFSCMPSTIVNGMLKKLSEACDHMPALSISYDGQQDPAAQTRLEAFVHQADAFREASMKRRGANDRVPCESA